MGFLARAAALLGLNMIDAANTQLAVSRGLGTELNPLMAWCISHGWMWFWLGKFAIVGLGIWALYRYRFYKAAGVAMAVALFIYTALVLYQGAFWLAHLLVG